MRFSVQGARIGMIEDGRYVTKEAFKVVGYQGAGINFYSDGVRIIGTTDEAKAELDVLRFDANAQPDMENFF